MTDGTLAIMDLDNRRTVAILHGGAWRRVYRPFRAALFLRVEIRGGYPPRLGGSIWFPDENIAREAMKLQLKLEKEERCPTKTK